MSNHPSFCDTPSPPSYGGDSWGLVAVCAVLSFYELWHYRHLSSLATAPRHHLCLNIFLVCRVRGRAMILHGNQHRSLMPIRASYSHESQCQDVLHAHFGWLMTIQLFNEVFMPGPHSFAHILLPKRNVYVPRDAMFLPYASSVCSIHTVGVGLFQFFFWFFERHHYRLELQIGSDAYF